MKQHIEGRLELDYDNNLSLMGKNTLAEIIEYNCREEEIELSPCGELDEEMGGVSLYIPNCSLSYYISNKEISLEEIQEKHLRKLFGAIDVYGENYGYSAWTIMGFNVDTLTIGNHNLNQILRSYIGKYIHILIDYE